MRSLALFVCAGLAWAQGGGEPVAQKKVAARAYAGSADMFVIHEMAPGKVVKNAPYSGQLVTEMTQVLADGNRIHHKTTVTVMRDSDGRTRNEVGEGNEVFINDPVSGVNYMLSLKTGTVRKFGGVVGGVPGGVVGGVPGGVAGGIVSRRSAEGSERLEQFVKIAKPPSRQVEQLGTRVIEGVQAEGTRTTMTIPAGEIGNEKPIEVVTERWYSPQLQTTVLTKTNDPRMGETVVRLTNISLAEPPRSAFEVPADFTVK